MFSPITREPVLGILFLVLGGLLAWATYKVLIGEIRGWKEAHGRPLNEGENIMPSPILGLISLAFIALGCLLLFSPNPA